MEDDSDEEDEEDDGKIYVTHQKFGMLFFESI